MSSDAKSQEKLWFHLVRFHHFTSDKTQGRVTCPRVYVGSWQEPFSLRSEADLSPTHARARTHTHTHTHTHTRALTLPTPARPPVFLTVGMTGSPLLSLLWHVSGHPSTDITLSLTPLQGPTAPRTLITAEDASRAMSQEHAPLGPCPPPERHSAVRPRPQGTYLCGYILIRSVFQQKLNHLQVILLCCHVQGCKAFL